MWPSTTSADRLAYRGSGAKAGANVKTVFYVVPQPHADVREGTKELRKALKGWRGFTLKSMRMQRAKNGPRLAVTLQAEGKMSLTDSKQLDRIFEEKGPLYKWRVEFDSGRGWHPHEVLSNKEVDAPPIRRTGRGGHGVGPDLSRKVPAVIRSM